LISPEGFLFVYPLKTLITFFHQLPHPLSALYMETVGKRVRNGVGPPILNNGEHFKTKLLFIDGNNNRVIDPLCLPFVAQDDLESQPHNIICCTSVEEAARGFEIN
jgi:hypothetical protein